jgi:hypothetical protein
MASRALTDKMEKCSTLLTEETINAKLATKKWVWGTKKPGTATWRNPRPVAILVDENRATRYEECIHGREEDTYEAASRPKRFDEQVSYVYASSGLL